MSGVRRETAGLLLGGLLASGVAAEVGPDPAAALERAISLAEASLQKGEFPAAESHYREALFEGWLLTGTLERLDGRLPEARMALDKAVEAAPHDPEAVFRLAAEHLWLREVETAERLFAVVAGARPIPQTHVLIGRAYRDAREYARARAELQTALRMDPSVRRAHYYLGMVILAEGGTSPERLEKARAEFQEELKLAPEDPLTNDQLGLALLEAGRAAEALPAFEKAIRGEERWLYLFHLGRCQAALERPGDAVVSSRRALELALAQGAGDEELERIHYQLGLALRQTGAAQEATTHLAQAGRLRSKRQTSPSEASATQSPPGDGSPLSSLAPQQRLELKRRLTGNLARAYVNLGVLQAQSQGLEPAERYARAAALFEKAAALDPDFPQVQSSLGVAYFNARQFEKSTAPLARALAAQPQDAGLKRMLAIACVNTLSWERAVVLLQDDPGREADLSLEFAYGLALLRSNRPVEAEKVFEGLVTRRGDSDELSLLLGQAQAAQGKDEAAAVSLRRAVELNPAAEGAHAALGAVLMNLGRTAEGLEQLETAVRLAPDNPQLHEQLGQAYRKLGRTAEAEQQLATLRRLQQEGRVPKP